MSAGRFLRTARHIPAGQLAQRLRILALRRAYAAAPGRPIARAARAAAGMSPIPVLPRLPDEIAWPDGLDALERRAADLERGHFVHLNRGADFSRGIRWSDEGASALWLYQLQYLGCAADLARTGRTAAAARVVAAWSAACGRRWDAVAWHPYPVSLRLANLCVAASVAGGFDALGPGVAAVAATHAAFLLRHVEHDVRGNHILENARALLWAGRCFRGGLAEACEREARTIVESEIYDQVLDDGGHFELSPMYHCIVMRGLLEMRALLGANDPLAVQRITPVLRRMGDFLAGILCPDGDIPLLGDAVRGFGPPPAALLRQVGTTPREWTGVRPFAATGLYVLRNERIWAIFDAGPVCPPYLPAHGQADSLTVEVWVDGKQVIADPGVFDYAGPERAWGRSSRSHSTVTIDDADTSEVYDSFRVGGRARIASVGIAEMADEVVARLHPFGARAEISRSLRLFGGSLTIEDTSTGPPDAGLLCSRMHLAPGAQFVFGPGQAPGTVSSANSRVADVVFEGEAEAEKGSVSREFGLLQESVILVRRVPVGAGHVRWVIGPP